MTKAEIAAAMARWVSQTKQTIIDHNLWLTDEQIVTAVRSKARSIGGKGGGSDSAILQIWHCFTPRSQ